MRSTTSFARHLRQQSSTAERHAWNTLRKFRALGHPVRRQHPVAGYFADFAIVTARLIIEIDGRVHDLPGRREADAERERALAAAGWRVLRFDETQARDADGLFATVAEAIGLSGD